MTGYTVHTGATEKFVAGWDQIFGGSRRKSAGRKKSHSTASRPQRPKKGTKRSGRKK
ncbi:MAG: hypothetical protein ACT4QC_14505 [Planctomycetaceae bacterium]